MSDILRNLANFMSGETNTIFILLFFTTIIVIYSIFIFYFYQFLAKKNIIELNLNQYNRNENPTLVKFFAVIFYIIEYIIFLPIITFFWFSILSVLVLILAEGISVNAVLLITTALVASVRATSYISKDLAKDLAKMVPFTLLAIALTKPGFFQVSSLISRLSEISSLFSNIPLYLIFIVGVELTMRTIDFMSGIFEKEKLED
tara:strand:+ start:192 stop:800 length:609 start_codon:yes stop_codon:yes gene_type:complete